MKKRVLFVDDEPFVLEGLRNRLRRQRERWDMSFVGSGAAALQALAESRFDVIVCDMRMPGMDGATLLLRVQQQYPEIVRIVLSGHAEFEAALRAVPVAHQFLSKPCDAGVLENVVERACALQNLVKDQAVREVVGRIDKLPTMPAVYVQLKAAATKQDVSMREVAQIVKQDPSLCAKMLQIVNSAFFRLSRRISRVEDAASYLGLNTIQRIVLAAELFATQRPGTLSGLSLESLQQHSLATASIAARIVGDKSQEEDAFVAGMLHDIGKLVLATALPRYMHDVASAMAAGGCAMHEAELRIHGVTHAEVGAYLLGIWGLPYFVVEAVANHHAPSRVGNGSFGLLTAVHVADGLANSLQRECDPGLDHEHLCRVGVEERLDGWREESRKDVAAVAAQWCTG